MRIGGYGLCQIVRQFKHFRIFPDAHPPIRGAHPENIRNKVQILDTRHIIVQIGIIGEIGEDALALYRLRPDGLAVDIDFAGIKLLDSSHGLHRCRFARTVVTDEAINLARRDMQIQVIDRFFFAVCFRQMFNSQHCYSPLKKGAE